MVVVVCNTIETVEQTVHLFDEDSCGFTPANNIGTLKIPFKTGYHTTQNKFRQQIAPHNTTVSKFTFHSNSQCSCNYLL
jgi:hypothetical protein